MLVTEITISWEIRKKGLNRLKINWINEALIQNRKQLYVCKFCEKYLIICPLFISATSYFEISSRYQILHEFHWEWPDRESEHFKEINRESFNSTKNQHFLSRNKKVGSRNESQGQTLKNSQLIKLQIYGFPPSHAADICMKECVSRTWRS